MLRKYRYLAAPIFVIVISSMLVACKNHPDPGAKKPELPKDDTYNPYQVTLDPVFEVRSISTPMPTRPEVSAMPEELKISSIPRENIYLKQETMVKARKPESRSDSKFSPVLEKWMADMDDTEIVDIIITFWEDLRIPLLPELEDDEKRENTDTQRAAAIAMLKRQREALQNKLIGQLAQYGHFEYLESFWIVNSIVTRVKLGEIKELSAAEFVVYMQPVEGGEEPPADMNDDNDAQDGRALIVSDPYFDLGLTSPWIGLIDTGVRDTHQMLNLPDQIAWMRDCINGGVTCNDNLAPNFDARNSILNHGTRSSGILTGNDLLGGQFRGVTKILTDSWRVYRLSGLDSAATIQAIQNGVAAFDRVLVGELQVEEDEFGAIATAADNAYDTGVIFVSANGNYGPNASTVRSPAIAHKVIGVGSFMTDGGSQYIDQGRGPATDGRFKPDIQTPTWSETASGASDTALAEFGGTSASTAYAAAAAMLSRNWLRRFGSYDNGQTYAFMILYGQIPVPLDNTVGAGPLEMATNGWAWWGKVAVTDQLNIDIPIHVATGKKDFDVALWWPEAASQDHNDIDVYLIDPYGVERSMSLSALSIFERAGVSGLLTPGLWTIRIRGANVRTQTQTVYWAAHIRN